VKWPLETSSFPLGCLVRNDGKERPEYSVQLSGRLVGGQGAPRLLRSVSTAADYSPDRRGRLSPHRSSRKAHRRASCAAAPRCPAGDRAGDGAGLFAVRRLAGEEEGRLHRPSRARACAFAPADARIRNTAPRLNGSRCQSCVHRRDEQFSRGAFAVRRMQRAIESSARGRSWRSRLRPAAASAA